MTRILYLHGFASSPASSKARYFAERLEAAGARVTVPDLAPAGIAHLTITSQLQLVEQIAAGEPVALIGSSLGGYVAALYAARHAEVTRLVLLAPAFGIAQRWLERPREGGEEFFRRTGFMNFYHYGEAYAPSFSLLDDGMQYEEYPDFGQPALIFHGAHDDVVPVELSQRFVADHANAALEIVDSDHRMLDALDSIGPRAAEFLLG
jgi:pimeloyl-ACP methyl ester carboxylesterase